MLIPISPRNRQSFFQSEPTASGTDSAKNGFAQPPIGEHDSEDFFSWTPSPPPVVECAGCSSSAELIPVPVLPHTPYPHKDADEKLLFPMAAQLLYCPASALITSHHVAELRSRLTIAGLHSRRREDFFWSHFFPRSVGFAPTASKANGAFTVAPSMLCHDQAIPSISSYSASPLRQRRENTPFRFHSKKYWWMELALPNSFFGKAFHWHPVRNTKIMPSKTFRGSMGLRPPPGRRKYFRFLGRFLFGISGSARFQSSSDTVHDLIALMAHDTINASINAINYLRISSKYIFIWGAGKPL